jgi:two-component system LytT family response regulator
MPGMNGFELLENLEWKQFSLVFTTAYREHALRAIRNNAADYLLKPIDHEELVMAVNRIKDKASSQTTNFSSFNYTDIFHAIHHSSRNKILLNSRLGIEPVDIDEIVSLESMSNYTHIHLSNEKKILSSKTLKEFDRLLCMNLDFMRVHHSFLINLRKVIRYIKETDLVVMANNQKIPVSKSRRDTFFKWLNA